MKNNQPVTQTEQEFKEGEILASRTDTKGIITYANQAFVDISGFTHEELIGHNHNIVRHPDMPAEAFEDLWNTVKKCKPWSGIVKNRCKNGDYYWVKATVTPIRKDGEIAEYMSVRVRPSRDEIAAAETLYKKINAGEATLQPNRAARVMHALRSMLVGRTLAIAYTSLIAAITAVIITIGIVTTNQTVVANEQTNLKEYHLAIQDKLNSETRLASAMAALVAEMPDAQQAFANDQRDRLLQMFQNSFKRLKKDFGVRQFQFHTPPATSYVRIHKPGKFGDDLTKKRPTIVKTNAEKAPVMGLDIGVFGLGLRGLTPVFKDGKHIGSVEFGMAFDNTFFEDFKKQYGVDVTLDLYRDEGLEKFGSTLENPLTIDPAHADSVLKGESVTLYDSINGVPVSVLRAPVRDFAGEVVGLLQVIVDRSEFVARMDNVRNMSIIIAAVSILVGLLLTYLIARTITRPLQRAVSVAQSITEGKYDNDIETDRDDETGELLQAMQTMQSHLNYDVHTVQEALRENLRVRSALDNVSSCVTVSDRNSILIYMNDAAVELFEELAGYIREEGTEIDVGALIGTKLSDFFPDDQLTAMYSEELTETQEGELVAWSHTLKLIASPVRDNEGIYQGRVTQWIDRTEELAMLRAEQERLQQERETAAANMRLKVALDNVSSNVMVADQAQEIIYVNHAAQRLFKGTESAIRADLAQFSASGLVGSKVETLLSPDPDYQQGQLDRLKETRQSEFGIGSLTLRTVTNPVVDNQGNRLGTVVEWTNRTEEVAVENEIDSIVESARAGDLTQRIDLNNKAGFFKQLGIGMNALIDETERVFTDIANIMGLLAQGDLTQSMRGDYRGTFGQVKDDINASMTRLDNIVREVRDGIDEINHTSSEISSGNTNLSSRTEQQASSLEETAASMEELTSTVRHNADNAQQANQVAASSRQHAEQGGRVVSEAISAMEQINNASSKIAEIIGVIDDIAFQTNLLALNASVEAARAGEQGRGFAVVATEVRNLASRSADAAKEIKVLIQDSVQKVKAGAELVDQTGSSLDEIVSGVKKVGDIVAEIAAASAEQSAGIDQVNQAVTSMDEVTQQNAALAEETSAASASLADKARNMAELVEFFQLRKVGS